MTGTLTFGSNEFRIRTSVRGDAEVLVVIIVVVKVVEVVVDVLGGTVVVGQTYSGHGQPSGQPD